MQEDGNRVVEFHYQGIFLEVLEELGKMPLPPYIKEELQDNERYQTVYSKINGSAAAPLLACTLPRNCSRRFKRWGSSCAMLPSMWDLVPSAQ